MDNSELISIVLTEGKILHTRLFKLDSWESQYLGRTSKEALKLAEDKHGDKALCVWFTYSIYREYTLDQTVFVFNITDNMFYKRIGIYHDNTNEPLLVYKPFWRTIMTTIEVTQEDYDALVQIQKHAMNANMKYWDKLTELEVRIWQALNPNKIKTEFSLEE